MKKFTKLLILFILSVLFLANVEAKEVKSVETEVSGNYVFVTGTTESGVLAVSIVVNKDDELVTIESTGVTDDNKYSDKLDLNSGTYTIKVADYDGGDYVTKTVTISDKVDEVKELVVESKNIDTDDVVAAILAIVEEDGDITGVSKELKETIKKAVLDGKSISIDLVVNEIKEKDVSEDTETIKKAKNKNEKILSYLDISIPVLIDGVKKGEITETDDKVEITVAVPEIKEKAKEGYTRVYSVLRLHDGKVDKLKATLNKDETLTFETDKFSTYAITYEDVKEETSPYTGDIIIVSIVLAIVSGVGLCAILIKNKFVK